jgi:Tfp pilus assembly protein PilO
MKTIITGILIAAGGALLFWVARPMWDGVLKLRVEQTEVRAALASLRDLEKLRDELLATYDSIPRDKLNRLNEILPTEKDISGILVNFEKMTQERGMLMKKIEFLKEGKSVTPRTTIGQSAGPASEISYSLSVVGSYEALRSLLLALEQNLRIVDVSTIGFSSGSGESALWDFAISAKSYYQPRENNQQ